jgi:hypothetical protein
MSMMASSTKRPMATNRPMSVEELRLMPSGTIASSDIAMEVGIAVSAINVPRISPKKKRTARPVRAIAMRSSSRMLPNSTSTNWALS